MRENYREYLNDVLRQGSTANGVFSAKIMWGHLSDFLSLATGDESTLSSRRVDSCLQKLFKGLRYIHVVRSDKLRQAISLWRAIQTQRWRKDAGKPPGKPWRHPVFDFTAIEALRHQIVEHDMMWNRFFSGAGLDPLVVHYEQVVNNPEETYRRIAAYTGIEVQKDQIYNTGMVKQAGPESERWISQYQKVLRSKQMIVGSDVHRQSMTQSLLQDEIMLSDQFREPDRTPPPATAVQCTSGADASFLTRVKLPVA
jgi:LPS sulfotransferase NodH